MIVRMSAEAKQYIIAEDLPEGDCVLEVSKTTEPHFGLMVVKGIHLPDGVKLAPLPPPKKVIECIGNVTPVIQVGCSAGDSDGTGNGATGPVYEHSYASLHAHVHWTDSDFAWPAYVGRSLGVDVQNASVASAGLESHESHDYGHNNKYFPLHEHYADRITFNWGVNEGQEQYEVGSMPPVDCVVIWIGKSSCACKCRR